jgi:phosphohistidine phosphatase SixA
MKTIQTLLLFISISQIVYGQAEIFVIRHAESTSLNDASPLLTEGTIRANKLAVLFSKASIQKIYVTAIIRNRQTADPLWRQIGGQANQLITYNSVAQLQLLVQGDIIAGRRILVVGHSNTVPQIITSIGVLGAPVVIGTEFDNLFQIIVRGAQRELFHFKYGL